MHGVDAVLHDLQPVARDDGPADVAETRTGHEEVEAGSTGASPGPRYANTRPPSSCAGNAMVRRRRGAPGRSARAGARRTDRRPSNAQPWYGHRSASRRRIRARGRPAVRAARDDQPERAVVGAEQREVFAEHPDRLAAPALHLATTRRRHPVAPGAGRPSGCPARRGEASPPVRRSPRPFDRTPPGAGWRRRRPTRRAPGGRSPDAFHPHERRVGADRQRAGPDLHDPGLAPRRRCAAANGVARHTARTRPARHVGDRDRLVEPSTASITATGPKVSSCATSLSGDAGEQRRA